MTWPSLPAWRPSWPPAWRPAWQWIARGGRLRLLAVGAGALVVIALITVAIYSSLALARFERVEERRATFVYAAPQPLVAGVHVRRVDLAGTLARLKYADSRAAVPAPGQFRRVGSGWEIHLRGTGESASQRVRIETRDERIVGVTRDGHDIGAATLEPEVLTSADDRPGEDHRPVRLAEVPLVLINAVLAAEDHRFFEHGGVDARGLLRAAWTNLRAGRVMQGGSTITQQLVKNLFLSSDKSYGRKLEEAALALLVDAGVPKARILEIYLNVIEWGPNLYGLVPAARHYFGKTPAELTPREMAFLICVIPSPVRYHQAYVAGRVGPGMDQLMANLLAKLRSVDALTDDAYFDALTEELRFRPDGAPLALEPAGTD